MRNERSRRHRTRRGSTLLEAIIAMGVVMMGAMGLMGLNNQGMKYLGDGRRITRATAIAQDLANQISLWPYTDARLANANASNDDDIGDTAGNLEASGPASAFVDHGEADLGATWLGIPAADLAANGFERYWNVSSNDPGAPGALLDANANGVADGLRVAIIVRWPQGSGWRSIVMYVTKINPADVQ
jgi:Tfp pilus assembly protein PilV